jgi:dienelactone hydrolase
MRAKKYNRLADTMARAGYLVVLPDYYKNDAVPKNTTGFDLNTWVARHPPAVVDPIIDATIKYMRGELGVKNIGVVGYCFGGRYVARFLAPGKGIQAGFTAHPSMVEKAEWQGITGPLSIAAAGTFSFFLLEPETPPEEPGLTPQQKLIAFSQLHYAERLRTHFRSWGFPIK